jgi:hypothetical protein
MLKYTLFELFEQQFKRGNLNIEQRGEILPENNAYGDK